METSLPTPMTARVELLMYWRVNHINHHLFLSSNGSNLSRRGPFKVRFPQSESPKTGLEMLPGAMDDPGDAVKML